MEEFGDGGVILMRGKVGDVNVSGEEFQIVLLVLPLELGKREGCRRLRSQLGFMQV